ncbi:MAG: hypothetical protein NVSMB6_23930 [Burkholderiaceae bacterium]
MEKQNVYDAAMKVSTSVAHLPYMSPVFVAMLGRAGIESVDQLRTAGAVETYLSLKRRGAAVSLPLLWALEAAAAGSAIEGISPARRGELFAAVASEQAEDQSRPPPGAYLGLPRKTHSHQDSLSAALNRTWPARNR